MHRSNPIGLVCGMLFLAALWVMFAWSHALPRRLQFWSTEAWLIAAAFIGFFLWWHGMQLRNLIRGVPTSKIASAPQGYVELAGRAASAKRYFPGAEEFFLWKRTQIASRLRDSFDTNRDGFLSGQELLDMHRAARKVAGEKAAEAAKTDGMNTLSPSPDGRRFIISTLLPEQLAGYYQWYLGIGLAMFFAALAGSVVFFRSFTFVS